MKITFNNTEDVDNNATTTVCIRNAATATAIKSDTLIDC